VRALGKMNLDIAKGFKEKTKERCEPLVVESDEHNVRNCYF
jgi:hypothetical protein